MTRETRETRVLVRLSTDRGDVVARTPIPFLNHLIETLIYYAGLGGEVLAEDKRGFDDHHIAEDVSLVIGSAIDRLLGDRVGIRRFGWAIIPMDDSAAIASVDLGGRPYTVVRARFARAEIGGLSTEMIPHMIRSMATTARATIHVYARGRNTHHKAEAMFKALGMALRMAMEKTGSGVMSLKGTYG